jgi:tetratricopeptide (TPR) repeat protein
MTSTYLAAALAALSLLAPPEKQAFEASRGRDARAEFLPKSALIEVDGKPLGRGYAMLPIDDMARTYRVRVSAEGFEPVERVLEASKIVDKQAFLALRPAGFTQKLDINDPAGMALAAQALWKAGRLDDAVDYAEQSLATGNTPLANRVLGEVWRQRGNRDQAIRYFTMYLSLTENPPDGPAIKAWLLQDRPGDITIPAK